MKLNRVRLFILILAVLAVGLSMQLLAANNEPFGDPHAIKGGQINLNTTEFPKSFNYFVNNASDAALVFGLVYETLMELHPTTLEFQPLIAKSLTLSPDKKEFTITVDPRARWADGKPITTADIKFTYDTVMNPKNLTSVQRISLSRFLEPVVIDKYRIKFTAKTVHYNNLVTLAGFTVLPKHLFGGKDFNKAFNMSLPTGSGPYELSEVKESRYYILKRRLNYWGDKLPQHRGMYNFNRIKFKVISDNTAFEAFKKGDYDVYTGITAKRWVTETNSKHFKNNWIIKQKVYNYSPQGFQGLAFNTRRPLFKDFRVRRAICHLIDRETLLKKIMFNQYESLTSYFPSLYGQTKANYPINYDPVKAKQLLAEAGYTKLNKDGYLINNRGERLEFTIAYSGDNFEKHLTLIADTCKQAGVKVNLELLSWPTLLKKMEEYKFDTVVVAWSASLFTDPEQEWHSKHLTEVGGSNLSAFKNPEVDRLIDSLPPIFDVNRRNTIIKKIDSLIYQESPYALFWGADYNRVLYKNVFGMPKTAYTKYGGGDGDILAYWWIDPAKVKRYQNAVKRNKSLPGAPVDIYYDKIAK